MDKKIKKEWVAALRSGEYKQTKERLCNPRGGMCCLGVLFDIAFDGEWIEEDAAEEEINKRFPRSPNFLRQFDGNWTQSYVHRLGDLFAYHKDYGVNSTGLTDAMRRRVGLNSNDMSTLMDMNDDGKKFSTIADFIEKEL